MPAPEREAIGSPTPPALRLGVTLGAAVAIQASSAALVTAPTVAAPQLLAALGAGPGLIGVYLSVVFAAAALASQWGVALNRRYGPVRCTQCALVLSAIGLPLVTVPHGTVAAFGALCIGLGLGPITPASSQMLSNVAPAGRLGLVYSLRQTGTPLGGAAVGLLFPWLLLECGLGIAVSVLTTLALATALLIQPLARWFDRQTDPRAPLPRVKDFAGPLRFTWSQPSLRDVALCGFVFSVAQCALMNFLVTWLERELRWTLVAAGAALSLVQVGAMLGRVGWGWAADQSSGGTRRTLLRLALVMAASSVAMPWLGPDSPAAVVLALLAVFGASAIGWNGVALAAVVTAADTEQLARATAGVLFLVYCGVVLGGPLFGLIAEALGSVGTAYAVLALPLLWTSRRLGRSPAPFDDRSTP